MCFAALIVWFPAVLADLYMLTVWHVETMSPPGRRAQAGCRWPVIVTHLLLAVAGLAVWVFAVVLPGTTMFARWIPIYLGRPRRRAWHSPPGDPCRPEGSFPVVVVLGHGLVAATTPALVLLTARGRRLGLLRACCRGWEPGLSARSGRSRSV